MLGRFWGTRRRCRVTTTHWRPERHTVTRKNIQSIQFLSCLVTVNKETPSGFISSSVTLIVMICVTFHRLHLCSYRPHCIPGQRKGWVCSKSQIWIKTWIWFIHKVCSLVQYSGLVCSIKNLWNNGLLVVSRLVIVTWEWKTFKWVLYDKEVL